MKFEHDERKARVNLEKHNVDFRITALIFSDPHILTIPDVDHSEEEDVLMKDRFFRGRERQILSADRRT